MWLGEAFAPLSPQGPGNPTGSLPPGLSPPWSLGPDKTVDAHRPASAQPHLAVGGQVFQGNYVNVLLLLSRSVSRSELCATP